jgi:hypothetical protein
MADRTVSGVTVFAAPPPTITVAAKRSSSMTPTPQHWRKMSDLYVQGLLSKNEVIA